MDEKTGTSVVTAATVEAVSDATAMVEATSDATIVAVSNVSSTPKQQTIFLNYTTGSGATEGDVSGLLKGATEATQEQVMVGYLEDGKVVIRADASQRIDLQKAAGPQTAQWCETEDGELMLIFIPEKDKNAAVATTTAQVESSQILQERVTVQQRGEEGYSTQSFYLPLDEVGDNLMSSNLPSAASRDGNVLATLIETGQAVPVQPAGMRNKHDKDAYLITTEDGYQCSACPNKIRRLRDAQFHIRSHTGDKPFKCSFCSKTFSRADYLTHHRRTHTGEKPYTCRHCGKCFACKVNLNRHNQLHTQEKPFSCTVCGARFARKFYLSNHMNRHLQIRPYRCVLCKMKFNQLCSLRGHIARHRHDRKYSCTRCVQKFYRKSGLDKHMVQHEKHNFIYCSKCGKASVTETSALRHFSNCTGETHFCTHCHTNFDDLAEYQAHIDKLFAERKNDISSSQLDDIIDDNFSDENDECEDMETDEKKPEIDKDEAENSVPEDVKILESSSQILTKTTPKSANKGKKSVSSISSTQSSLQSNLVGKVMALSGIPNSVDNDTVTKDDELEVGSQPQQNPLQTFAESILDAQIQQNAAGQQILVCPSGDAGNQIILDLVPEQSVIVDGSTEQTTQFVEIVSVNSSGVGDHANYAHKELILAQQLATNGQDRKKKSSEKEKVEHRCFVCEKTFSRRDNLLSHMRIHQGVKPHKCQFCSRSFHHKGNFNKHLKTHSDDRPYVCQVCDKGFSRSTYLKHHMRVHTGEKPYKCDKCGKTFALSSVLHKHNLMHEDKRPHPCTTCGKRFRSGHNLRHHQKRCHSGNVMFLCSTCKKHCETKEDLIKHCEDVHNMVAPAPGDDTMKFLIASDHGKVVLKQATPAVTPGLDDILSNLDEVVEEGTDEEEEVEEPEEKDQEEGAKKGEGKKGTGEAAQGKTPDGPAEEWIIVEATDPRNQEVDTGGKSGFKVTTDSQGNVVVIEICKDELGADAGTGKEAGVGDATVVPVEICMKAESDATTVGEAAGVSEMTGATESPTPVTVSTKEDLMKSVDILSKPQLPAASAEKSTVDDKLGTGTDVTIVDKTGVQKFEAIEIKLEEVQDMEVQGGETEMVGGSENRPMMKVESGQQDGVGLQVGAVTKFEGEGLKSEEVQNIEMQVLETEVAGEFENIKVGAMEPDGAHVGFVQKFEREGVELEQVQGIDEQGLGPDVGGAFESMEVVLQPDGVVVVQEGVPGVVGDGTRSGVDEAGQFETVLTETVVEELVGGPSSTDGSHTEVGMLLAESAGDNVMVPLTSAEGDTATTLIPTSDGQVKTVRYHVIDDNGSLTMVEIPSSDTGL